MVACIGPEDELDQVHTLYSKQGKADRGCVCVVRGRCGVEGAGVAVHKLLPLLAGSGAHPGDRGQRRGRGRGRGGGGG
jgi:hypothetical protein